MRLSGSYLKNQPGPFSLPAELHVVNVAGQKQMQRAESWVAAWGISVWEEKVQGGVGFDAKEVWCGGTGRKLGHSGLCHDSGASLGLAGLSFLGTAGM